MRASRWTARASALSMALAWRTRREGLRYLIAAVLPLVIVLVILGALPALTNGKGINGAHSIAVFGLRYGAHANAVAVGLLLVATPGMIALFSAIAVGRVVRGLIGADVGRGGMEALLSAPYSAGTIAAALLGYAIAVATAFWLVMSVLGAIAIAIITGLNGGELSLGGWYFALGMTLPLLAAWAGAGLSMLVCLLFPRLTQLGATVSVAGGDLGTAIAVVPATGTVLTLFLGLPSFGPAPLLLIVGGAAGVIAALSVTLAAAGFRPETVLDA